MEDRGMATLRTGKIEGGIGAVPSWWDHVKG
jgi:hypothetical protein